MKKIQIILFLQLFIIFSTPSAWAEDAVIEDVRVKHGATLDISFFVTGALTEDIMEAISSGIDTSFTYIVSLEREKAFFPDKHIQTFKFNHSVKYDNLKKLYFVTQGRKAFGADDIELVLEDIEEMKKQMVTVENISFVPKIPFESGYTYNVYVMAELDVVDLPLSAVLDYVLFFVKLWDFETDWYKYKFTY